MNLQGEKQAAFLAFESTAGLVNTARF
jgi:hypothetical protein